MLEEDAFLRSRHTTNNIRLLGFFFDHIDLVKVTIYKLDFRELRGESRPFVAIANKTCDVVLRVRFGYGVESIPANVACGAGNEDFRHFHSNVTIEIEGEIDTVLMVKELLDMMLKYPWRRHNYICIYYLWQQMSTSDAAFKLPRFSLSPPLSNWETHC